MLLWHNWAHDVSAHTFPRTLSPVDVLTGIGVSALSDPHTGMSGLSDPHEHTSGPLPTHTVAQVDKRSCQHAEALAGMPGCCGTSGQAVMPTC